MIYNLYNNLCSYETAAKMLSENSTITLTLTHYGTVNAKVTIIYTMNIW